MTNVTTTATEPTYLKPYLDAARRYGDGFGSLLWASPRTQKIRFGALTGAISPRDLRVLDVGCGRADLLTYMCDAGRRPAEYVGVEMVDELATSAEGRLAAAGVTGRIVRRDFIADPDCMRIDADVIYFSGSLNTLSVFEFELSVRRAFSAARLGIAFNFLSSTQLSSARHLVWHRINSVISLGRSIVASVRVFDDYLDGDTTVAMTRDFS
jgi:SAM-dependent methyltransferase